MNPADLERFQAALAQFKRVAPLYERLGEFVQAWCHAMAEGLGLHPIVMARTKGIGSFAEKICRPGKDYVDPLRQITDLCGVRVIVHTLDEVLAFAHAVEAAFVIDVGNSEDKRNRLAYREFGYLSRHYILQLRAAPAIDGLDETSRAALATLRFELQVRTLAQHLWADVYHVLGYKNEFRLPARWEREFARLAAMLEECDKGFQAIKDAMRTYETSYSAYMSQDDLRALADRLALLLDVDPDNPDTLHRLLRARLSMEDAAVPLGSFIAQFDRRLDGRSALLRDKGVALCQVHKPGSPEYQAGIDALRRAVEGDSRDVDAWCSLGGALRRQGAIDEAIDCYRRAHELDPTNPYPLGNFIAEELIRHHDAGIVRFFHAAIGAAAERCERQVEACVNLPWALFDLGLFALFRGDPLGAVMHYAAGIADAPRTAMVRSAGSVIGRLLRAGLALDGIASVDRLLELACWLRASGAERAADGWQPASGGPAFDCRPVIVIAGAAAGLTAEFVPDLDQLGKLLAGVRGTLVGGGTTAGVSGLVGVLQAHAGTQAMHSVGYVPALGAAGIVAQLDRRYQVLRHTEGDDFSALEPLKFWEDFAAAGGDAAGVRVIGFNGGAIAAAEFRIALAFGARVGVVRGSGRAADELLADARWNTQRRLQPLSLTQASIDAFLGETT